MNCGFGGKNKTQSFQKLFSGGHLFIFVEYLCKRSLKIKTKNIKNYNSILAIVNHRNWLDDSPPLTKQVKKSLDPCSKDSHRLSLLQGPCVTTEIITEKFDVLRGRLLGNHNDVHWQLGGQINHQPCSCKAARVIR